MSLLSPLSQHHIVYRAPSRSTAARATGRIATQITTAAGNSQGAQRTGDSSSIYESHFHSGLYLCVGRLACLTLSLNTVQNGGLPDHLLKPGHQSTGLAGDWLQLWPQTPWKSGVTGGRLFTESPMSANTRDNQIARSKYKMIRNEINKILMP